MEPTTSRRIFRGGILDTLAQRETRPERLEVIEMPGKGSDLRNRKALRGRAKRKLITQKMALSLIHVANKKGDGRRAQSYRNTYYCQNKVITSDGRLYGRYCKNRHCTLCCSIRKGVIINRYLPVVQQWPDPYFVTLTIKAVPFHKLSHFVTRGMVRAFQRIVRKYRKRSLRGKGKPLVGIKSLECNFNAAKRTYNPHFHLIVPDRETAEILINEWLKLWTPKFARRVAQNMSPITNKEIALMEVVKYGSKIFSEPDVTKKSTGNGKRKIYAAALDNIFIAMQGHRVFERFGFNLPPASIECKNVVNVLSQFQDWEYDCKRGDWKNTHTGETLSGYIPASEMIELLNNNIDTAEQ